MDAPVRSKSLAALTGGYASLANPSDPIPGKTPILSIPTDVLLLVFNLLNKNQRARCAQTCNKWRIALKTEHTFFQAQFTARYNVLNYVLSNLKIKDNEGNQLLEKAQYFIDLPELYLVKSLQIPSQATRIQSAVELFFPKKIPGSNPLLIEMQRWIEEMAKKRKLTIMDFTSTHFFTYDPSDPYFIQAYHDCLMPVLKNSMPFIPQPDLPAVFRGVDNFTPLMFNLICEAVLRYGDQKMMNFTHRITSIKSPDQLEGLNRGLPHTHHLEHLSLTHPQFDFSWTAGKGIAALKTGLVKAPKLHYVRFAELGSNLIDANNGKALADIVMTRQRERPHYPFTVIHFGASSISREGLDAFIDGLRNYPVPIIIWVMQDGNVLIYCKKSEEYYSINNQLNIRFRTAEPIGSTCETFDHSLGMMMGAHLTRVEKIEMERNKHKPVTK